MSICQRDIFLSKLDVSEYFESKVLLSFAKHLPIICLYLTPYFSTENTLDDQV